jgi:ribosomal protein S18 acetylase RimI-like enzyme
MNPFNPFRVALDIVIRPCRAEDLPTLEWFGLFEPHRQIIRETFDRHRRGEVVMLVADVNGVPSGQAWIDARREGAGPAGVLWAVRVFPCLQNCGIGSRLIAAAEHVLRAHDCHFVEVQVEKDNPAARRLYERLGYQVFGERREDYHFTTPDGSRATLPLDQWVLQKAL